MKFKVVIEEEELIKRDGEYIFKGYIPDYKEEKLFNNYNEAKKYFETIKLKYEFSNDKSSLYCELKSILKINENADDENLYCDCIDYTEIEKKESIKLKK